MSPDTIAVLTINNHRFEMNNPKAIGAVVGHINKGLRNPRLVHVSHGGGDTFVSVSPASDVTLAYVRHSEAPELDGRR